jgi:predicted metal-dependent phosphoesterase TrpH
MEMKEILERHVFFQTPALEKLKEEYMLIDMHVHTSYSHDSKSPLSGILKKAKLQDIGLAITDHNRAEGALEAGKQKKITIIPGIEVLSKEGKELLIYFYSMKDLEDFYCKSIKNNIMPAKNHVLKKRFFSVKVRLPMSGIIESASGYSCVKSIPHPFTYPPRNSHSFFKRHRDLLRSIDAVETLNSTVLPFLNNRAAKWSIKLNKTVTAGSDAHTISHIGSCLVACKASSREEFLDEILKKRNIILGNELKLSSAIRTIVQINNIKKAKVK